ncbi:MAG: hypothetical protein JM58_17595 [Peptococcaceae bacterium BICA1-8]|nr:MAG: hypothetical protein JM58_17595 [Peptococcaceae bacterium BICA1-8]
MDRINKLIMRIVALLLAIIFVLLFAQVIFRFVINQSFSWSEEVARYLTIWMVFLGVAIGVRKQSLIAVEVVVQSVPKKIKTILKVMVLLITLVFSVFLIVFGKKISMMSIHDVSTALSMPMWIAYAAIPVGGILTFLNTFVALIETLAEREGD